MRDSLLCHRTVGRATGNRRKKFNVSKMGPRMPRSSWRVIAFLFDISLKLFFVSKKCTHARIFSESALGSDPNVFQGAPDTSVVVSNFDIMFETSIYFMKNLV